jgi:hypothetical protein
MFNKGDKVSVLDEALNGVVLSTKGQYTIETEEGFVMTFFCPCNCLKATIPVI